MARARKIDVGTEKIYAGIKKNKYQLVVLAKDAQDKTREKIERLTTAYHVPLINLGTKEQLAAAIGKELTVAIAIKDKGFSDALNKKIEK